MRTEVPVCKRCCFCLPLRYGLITWGYLRWAVSMFFLVGMSISFCSMLAMTAVEHRNFNISFIILGCLLLLAMTDSVLNAIFIVGGHKKNLILLRAYYIYSIFLCSLTGLVGIVFTVYSLILFEVGEVDLVLNVWIFTTDVAALWGQVFIQIYVLLLVRSEIIKLNSNCEFRFVNNATDAECTLQGKVEVNGEVGTECNCISTI